MTLLTDIYGDYSRYNHRLLIAHPKAEWVQA